MRIEPPALRVLRITEYTSEGPYWSERRWPNRIRRATLEACGYSLTYLYGTDAIVSLPTNWQFLDDADSDTHLRNHLNQLDHDIQTDRCAMAAAVYFDRVARALFGGYCARPTGTLLRFRGEYRSREAPKESQKDRADQGGSGQNPATPRPSASSGYGK